MPRDFRFPTRETQFWTPYRFKEEDYRDRDDNYLVGIGRLKPDVSLAQARSELSLIAARLRRQYPKENEAVDLLVVALRDGLSSEYRLLLKGLCGAALCVLVIACGNLANLLLARSVARQRELSIRLSLGASRRNLLRQLVSESLLLGLAGGATRNRGRDRGVAAAVTIGAQPAPDPAGPSRRPADVAVRAGPDPGYGRRFWRRSRIAGVRKCRLQRAARGRAQWRNQHSARTIGAGGRGSYGVRRAPGFIGITHARVVESAIHRPWIHNQWHPVGAHTVAVSEIQQDQHSRSVLYKVLTDVRRLPGVTDAAYITALPMTWGGGIWPVEVNGRSLIRTEGNSASLRFVTPGLFSTLGIPIRSGRAVSEPTQRTGPTSPWSANRSCGDTGHMISRLDGISSLACHDHEVIGIVGDIRARGLERTSEPQVYLSSKQDPDDGLTYYAPKDLVIHSSQPPERLLPAIRQIIHAADAEQPISNVRTMERWSLERLNREPSRCECWLFLPGLPSCWPP